MAVKMRFYCKTVLLILLFLFGFLIAGGLFPAINGLFSPARAKNQRDAIKIRWLKGFSAILNLHIIKEGDVAGRPVFVASNHISWLDIIVLGQFVPGCFIAKNDIARWPVIGFLSKQAGTIFIRRGDKKQILKTAEMMAWQLRQNGNIITFPEGTTTTGEVVLDFHASLFQPALLTKSPIQPAIIQYLGKAKESAPFIGDDGFVPHLLQMLKLNRIDVKLSLLPATDGSGRNRNAISGETRRLIAEVIALDTPSVVAPAHSCNNARA